MSLVDSLLDALVRLDGDALVMHVGEKPYVVTASASLDAFRGPLAWGQVELATRRLSVEAVAAMVERLLPPAERAALAELGAVQYELPPRAGVPGRFSVIAARGGDDIWLELRYHRPPRPQVEFEPSPAAAPPAEPLPAAGPPQPPQVDETAAVPELVAGPSVEATAEAVEPTAEALPLADRAPSVPGGQAAEPAPAVGPVGTLVPVDVERAAARHVPQAEREPIPQPPAEVGCEPVVEAGFEVEAVATPLEALDAPEIGGALVPTGSAEGEAQGRARAPEEEREAREEVVYDLSSALAEIAPAPLQAMPAEAETEPEVVAEVPAVSRPALVERAADAKPGVEPERAPLASIQAEPPARAAAEAAGSAAAAEPDTEAARPAVVLPLTRSAARVEVPPPTPAHRSPLDRLLRLAAARGASALYLVAESRPVLRVEGEIRVLDSEEALAASDVAAMLMELAPDPTRDALRTGAVTEWICDVPEVGRVRCMSFRDHRGPGGIFRMLPARALSVEQLGLSPAIQGLCGESEGLVLVAGPRSSGKSTLIAAFVDLINRTRADHVITLETQIMFVHESRRSFVSQREWRERGEEMAAAARAALREDPDVLVIDDLRSPDLVSAALDAAGSGRLVFAALPAAGATAAVERVIDQFPLERRAQAQTALAASLRAVVAQVLVRKVGGGRVAAREVLLGTRPVAALLAEGRTAELPHAIEAGRRHGMVPLNDALVGFVGAGLVDPAEAYRRTPDKEGLLAQLRRDGVDTSFVERLA